LDSAVRRWLIRFAALYDKQISSALPSIWVDALKDIPPTVLAEAMKKIELTFVPTNACPFPTPAHIHNLIGEADSEGLDADAEDAWQYVLRYARKFVLPGIGLASDAPPLDPIIEKAASAAGGLARIERCPTEELVWARKTFIENYKRLHRLPEHSLLISNGEARKILADLATPKQLPAVVRAVSAPAVVAPRTVPKKPGSAPVELSEEEWQRGKDEQKRRLGEYLAAQSCSKNPVPPVPVTASADGAALR